MKNRVAPVLAFSLLLAFQINEPLRAEDGRTSPQGEAARSHNADRAIKLEIVINAPPERVWKAWTTRDGIRSFFAPDCDIDLRVLGKYDILFAPTAPVGLRGAEGNLILAIQETQMLSFTWDAPPNFPDVRKQRTSVVIRFARMDRGRTKLVLTQTGWGDGEEWNKAYDYFVVAWGDFVLPHLKYSLEAGPIDWKNPPQKLEKAIRIAD